MNRDDQAPIRVMTVAQYYADPGVRERIREYFGGGAGRQPTAAFAALLPPTTPPPITWHRALRRPGSRLDSIWTENADIARSLLDRENLIFFFELDYVNSDLAGEPFIHPAEVLFKLEPTYLATRKVLRSFGLSPYTLVTGRGYHFVGRVRLDSAVTETLASQIADVPPWLGTVSTRTPGDVASSLSARTARAWTQLGHLVEFLAHRVWSAARHSPIPVVFNGLSVGSGLVGRECVSLDFSFVGDPLDVRCVRTAYSTYQWHRFRSDIVGRVASSAVPPLAAVPRERTTLPRLMRGERHLNDARKAAQTKSAVIPDVTEGVAALREAYERSPLATFHRSFQADRRSPSAQPRTPPDDLPPCAQACLVQPNDLLLKPDHIQHLVRTLLARRWTAADVAALVQSRYEEDHGWGDRWTRWMDARTRAEFDVRVFAGMLATGVDQMIDFNCVSAQEKGLCPFSGCSHDLRDDRERVFAQKP